VFRVLNLNMQVEQNEKSIAASLEISNDEQDEEEAGEKDEKLFLPLYRHTQNTQASFQKKRRAAR
jgi:hypothetical protein